MSEWLSEHTTSSPAWANLPLLTEEEVQKRFRRLGVGWVQTPAAAGEGPDGELGRKGGSSEGLGRSRKAGVS
jgi:hypothetical protein